jgi:signal transduction histidine kinase
VRAVAQSHGGSVDAGKSTYGGARFSVRLPLEKPGKSSLGERDATPSEPRQKL